MKKRIISLILSIILSITTVLAFCSCAPTEPPKKCAHEWQLFSDANGHWYECFICGEKQTANAHEIIDVKENTATYGHAKHTAGKQCSICEYMTEGSIIEDKRSGFIKMTFDKGGVNELNYNIYRPFDEYVEGDKYPLFLFLHGAGERGRDNEAQLKNAICKVVNNDSNSKFMDSVVLAPQCPTTDSWVSRMDEGNYNLSQCEETATMKKVVKLVETYASYPYIDTSAIYVFGLSMGGYGAWDILARHSDLFTAGGMCCSGGPIDAVNVLKDIPIFVFHGDSDSIVDVMQTSRPMVHAIRLAGGEKIRYVEFAGKNHNVWDDAITFSGNEQNPSFETWLFSQTK